MLMTSDVATALLDIEDAANRLFRGVGALTCIADQFKNSDPNAAESMGLDYLVEKISGDAQDIRMMLQCIRRPPHPIAATTGDAA